MKDIVKVKKKEQCDLNFNFVVICSTPRSGSSTFMDILNTIQDANIVGESDGAILNLLKTYKSIKNTLNFRPTHEKPSTIKDFNDEKLSLAWYNSFDFEDIKRSIQKIIIKICKNSDTQTLFGFKEIRFDKNMDLLIEFIELFPKTKVICTIRNDLDSQSKSKHFSDENIEKVKKFLENYTNQILKFQQDYPDKCIIIKLEEMYDMAKLESVFKFLEKKADFNPSKIQNILNKKFTTIYFRYKNLVPENFDPNLYKQLNLDLYNLMNYDALVHYVNKGKEENRKIKFDIVAMTIVKNDNLLLLEWILYHFGIGIQHFYIFDDMSTCSVDNFLEKHLSSEIYKRVSVFTIKNDVYEEFKHSEMFDKYKSNKQLYIIDYFVMTNKHVSDLCLFCDVDEFIEITNSNKKNDIYSTLTELVDFEKYDGIYLNYIQYGTSFNVKSQNTLVTETYTYCNNKYDDLGKSICKLNKCNQVVNAHIIFDKTERLFKFDSTQELFTLPIHINHYVARSVKDYISKKIMSEIGTNYGALRSPDFIYSNILENNNCVRKEKTKCSDIVKNKCGSFKYDFDKPKYDVEECIQRGFSYSAPLKVTLRLIIMDIDMPVKNGFEASEDIIDMCIMEDINYNIVMCSAFCSMNDI
jgi:hypothetical protein